MSWSRLDLAHLCALAAALGFASGIRLYALLWVIGMTGYFHWIDLPSGMHVLSNSVVLSVTGVLTLVEFLADKVPAIDTLWDAIHTFIRLPAGALLAATLADGFSADLSPIGNEGVTVALALLGGSFAVTSHFAKAGSRAALNTSPEPFSNWAASVSEDIFSIGLLWLIIFYPIGAGLLVLILATLCVWLVRHLWRFVSEVFHKAGFASMKSPPSGGRHVSN